MDLAIEIIGWAGAFAVLGAYLLAARGGWPATGAKSAATNVVGATFLTVNGLYHGALPSVGLNVVWMTVGAATLIRRSRHSEQDGRPAS
jgi:hypothetical protein